jgi:hypothetical protein
MHAKVTTQNKPHHQKVPSGEKPMHHMVSTLGEFTMVSQPIRLILVDLFVFHFRFFWRSSSIFVCFFRSSSIFFLGILSSWVKLRLHTQSQLPKLSESALKVPGCWGGGWWLPTHYQVRLLLQLRLSWAVKTSLCFPFIWGDRIPWNGRTIGKLCLFTYITFLGHQYVYLCCC